METGIVLSNREVTLDVFTMAEKLAPVLRASQLMGVGSPEQAMAIMLKGYELGMSLTTSFEFIQVIQGKPALSPRGALALIHNSKAMTGYKLTRLVDKDKKFIGFECWMQREGDFEHTAHFTLEDAKQADLWKSNGGYDKYPENMCMWRAIGFCADVVFPDITGGLTLFLKMPEASNIQVSDTGDWVLAETKVIDAKPAMTQEERLYAMGIGDKPKPAPVKIEVKPQPVTMDQLLSLFGGEAIMAANNGKLPSTDAEVEQVAMTLLGG